MHRLKPHIEHAEQTYLRNVERLARTFPHAQREINAGNVLLWLAQVEHELSDRMSRADAIANGPQQRVRYSTKYLDLECNDGLIEDLVLHELGHLFTWHFLDTLAHDDDWRLVGFVTGYVPLGSTSYSWRRTYRETELLPYRMGAAIGDSLPEELPELRRIQLLRSGRVHYSFERVA